MNEWKLTGNGGRGHCGGDGHREWRHDEPRCRKWRNQCRHYHVSVTHGTTPSTRHPTDWTEVLWQWHSKGRLLGWILMTLLVSDHQQVFHDSVFLTFCTAAQTYDTHTHTHAHTHTYKQWQCGLDFATIYVIYTEKLQQSYATAFFLSDTLMKSLAANSLIC